MYSRPLTSYSLDPEPRLTMNARSSGNRDDPRTPPGSEGVAILESEVLSTGEGTFVESGTISYGDAGRVAFRTVGQGVTGASAIEGLRHGAVIWEVMRGEGRLAGAQGLITSNFTVGRDGQVTDNHFVRLFLPAYLGGGPP